jgi:hypothetical protein
MVDRTHTEPSLIDLVQELRRTVGLFDGAMPVTPKEAWEEAIREVEKLVQGRCYRCVEKDRWSDGG